MLTHAALNTDVFIYCNNLFSVCLSRFLRVLFFSFFYSLFNMFNLKICWFNQTLWLFFSMSFSIDVVFYPPCVFTSIKRWNCFSWFLLPFVLIWIWEKDKLFVFLFTSTKRRKKKKTKRITPIQFQLSVKFFRSIFVPLASIHWIVAVFYFDMRYFFFFFYQHFSVSAHDFCFSTSNFQLMCFFFFFSFLFFLCKENNNNNNKTNRKMSMFL